MCKVGVFHVCMAHRGSEAELYSFIIFTLNETECSHGAAILSQRKESPCLLDRKLRWLHGRLELLEKRKLPFVIGNESQLRSFGPLFSHYEIECSLWCLKQPNICPYPEEGYSILRILIALRFILILFLPTSRPSK